MLKKSYSKLALKAAKVINSCQTPAQLIVAKKWYKRLPKEVQTMPLLTNLLDYKVRSLRRY